MDRTADLLRRFFAALPAPGYDLGILDEGGMYRIEAAPEFRIFCMLPLSQTPQRYPRTHLHAAHWRKPLPAAQ